MTSSMKEYAGLDFLSIFGAMQIAFGIFFLNIPVLTLGFSQALYVWFV